MRAKGITYDTGFTPGLSSRPEFDPDAVKEEIRVVAEDLHCDAVRIIGGDPERMSVAARHAVDAGLEVWFSPFPSDLTTDDMRPYFAECADRAEAVGAQVFVTGCELSLFAAGFLPGADLLTRVANFTSGDPAAMENLAEATPRINAFLAETVTTVRKRFGGKVTYASALWEEIDWEPFDIVGIDAYVDPEDPACRPGLRQFFRHGKPIAVTEFGCCTYRGAAARSGIGWDIADHEADPPRIKGDYVRDEDEQVRYMRAIFDLAEDESVDTAFWFTFASYSCPHHEDPRFDLDLAAFGVCKVMPDGSLEPKRAFHALAEICR
ncbi:hypothetical protein [Nocardia mexicana]|uniref:Abortive infection protein n=1 Tax=Nocardia mexicana TaxID=279262 RepID=A0A370GZH9_9NOCA|nr:hypothetical protein [Nocardia mexicana]RDI49038.1 hypothetical protein DFR68_107163 [Nocardia mexicana]